MFLIIKGARKNLIFWIDVQNTERGMRLVNAELGVARGLQALRLCARMLT